jgi:hypothetical protein
MQNKEDHTQDQSSPMQDQPRNAHYSPRGSDNANYNNSTPSSTVANLFCIYKNEHMKEGINQCKNNLIGKILSHKPILKPILQNTLLGIWGNPQGFTIAEIEGGLFHIAMDLDMDIQKTIKGNPWIIRNSWFMVHQWDMKLNPSNFDFQHVPVWIQIWGLLIHCKTITMGKHLGTQLRKVENLALYDYPKRLE